MTFQELKKELKKYESISKTIDSLTYTFYKDYGKYYLKVQERDAKNKVIESVILGDDIEDADTMYIILKYIF